MALCALKAIKRGVLESAGNDRCVCVCVCVCVCARAHVYVVLNRALEYTSLPSLTFLPTPPLLCACCSRAEEEVTPACFGLGLGVGRVRLAEGRLLHHEAELRQCVVAITPSTGRSTIV